MYLFSNSALKHISGSVFTFSNVLTTQGSPWSSVGLFCFHVQVFEPTYLSTYALPHIHFLKKFLWPQTHSMLLKKKWPQNQVGRPQHFTLCKAIKKICEALPVLQTDNLTFQSSAFSLKKWREKVPIAEGPRSLHNYIYIKKKNCCSVKAYNAMNCFNYYHW